MTRVDLEEDLKRTSDVQLKEARTFDAQKEVKLLLEANDAEKERVLSNFGLDDSLKMVQAKRGILIEMEDFESQYGNCFQLGAIRAMAIKYRMRFLPLTSYKGAIDPQLAGKLLEFGKKHNIDVTHSGAQDMFYVLAPAEDFRLEVKENVIIERKIVSRDPLLFYRGDTKNNKNREGQLWTLIHKWGTDLNIFRAVSAWPVANAKNYWMTNAACITAIAFLLITALFSTFTYSPWAVFAVSAVFGCVGAFIRHANMSETDEKNKFTESNWSDNRYHVDVKKTVIEYR
jgi:hypothetical protein